MGLTITRDDITQREFMALLILREERDKVREQRERYREAEQARAQPNPKRSFDG